MTSRRSHTLPSRGSPGRITGSDAPKGSSVVAGLSYLVHEIPSGEVARPIIAPSRVRPAKYISYPVSVLITDGASTAYSSQDPAGPGKRTGCRSAVHGPVGDGAVARPIFDWPAGHPGESHV